MIVLLLPASQGIEAVVYHLGQDGVGPRGPLDELDKGLAVEGGHADGGVERGTHGELVLLGGRYAALLADLAGDAAPEDIEGSLAEGSTASGAALA